MSGVAISRPEPRVSASSKFNRDGFWALFCVLLLTLIAMIGLPVVNTLTLSSSDLNGQWVCMQSCPKTTSFMLQGGAVYRDVNGKMQPVGYWKLHSGEGLVLKARTSQQKQFKWMFFRSEVNPTVTFRYLTGTPQFCVDRKGVWCFEKSSN
ncbi:hypothetical protein [Deinococcus misasensis]|uniref:hypothetical protein n=1 Tax=Deinococcus misasensis TaxID=392413 RepID=UPI0005516970|nr:hypothetical protein [Deinococcus misasensis]